MRNLSPGHVRSAEDPKLQRSRLPAVQSPGAALDGLENFRHLYILSPFLDIYLSVHFFGFAWIFPIARFKYRMASAFLMVMNSPASEKGDF